MALQFAYVLSSTDSSSFDFDPNDPLVAEKQVIYVDRFYDKKFDIWHDVEESDIDNWVAQFSRFVENGIEVPLPEEHEVMPSTRKGSVIALSKKPDEKGRVSLFAKVRFKDAEAKKEFSDSQVSLYSPPEFEDGKKNHYPAPITHLALTDYPLVPDLGKWRTISASSVVNPKQGKHMLREFAISLGLTVAEDATDESISAQLTEHFQGQTTELNTQTELVASLQTQLAESRRNERPAPAAPIAAGILNVVKNARTAQLSALVTAGKIDEATRKSLAARYVDDEKALSFSLSGTEGADDFDFVVQAFSANTPVPLEGSTGPQVLKFSSAKDGDTKTSNALTRTIQKRSGQPVT